MCWLLKEPFLATYSAMSNPNSMKQGVVAPKRAFFNILLPRLEPPPQLELPCAKRDQCIFAHFSGVTFFAQNFLIPCTSSCLLCGFTFDSKKNLSSCHKSSIGLRSGLSGGVRHQLIFFSLKKAFACLDVCFGSLSCMNQ